MTKLMTKPQPEQDEQARRGKRAASRADAPATPTAPSTRASASVAHQNPTPIAKHDKGNQTTRSALGNAHAASTAYTSSYTSTSPVASRGAHAYVAPSPVESVAPAPTWPTLPNAPTRLEASLTTVGDLARRYPSVAAFIPTGMPAPMAPTAAPTPTRTKQAKTAQGAQATSQPSSQPATGMRQRFAELRAALAEGWEIVQPIFARPLWSVADDSATAFNFVLSRAQATRLVTVPEGRPVSRFIRDQELVVDYRR